jgi:hypothetical protein
MRANGCAEYKERGNASQPGIESLALTLGLEDHKYTICPRLRCPLLHAGRPTFILSRAYSAFLDISLVFSFAHSHTLSLSLSLSLASSTIPSSTPLFIPSFSFLSFSSYVSLYSLRPFFLLSFDFVLLFYASLRGAAFLFFISGLYHLLLVSPRHLFSFAKEKITAAYFLNSLSA